MPKPRPKKRPGVPEKPTIAPMPKRGNPPAMPPEKPAQIIAVTAMQAATPNLQVEPNTLLEIILDVYMAGVEQGSHVDACYSQHRIAAYDKADNIFLRLASNGKLELDK